MIQLEKNERLITTKMIGEIEQENIFYVVIKKCPVCGKPVKATSTRSEWVAVPMARALLFEHIQQRHRPVKK
jgi:hypothetical protein